MRQGVIETEPVRPLEEAVRSLMQALEQYDAPEAVRQAVCAVGDAVVTRPLGSMARGFNGLSASLLVDGAPDTSMDEGMIPAGRLDEALPQPNDQPSLTQRGFALAGFAEG